MHILQRITLLGSQQWGFRSLHSTVLALNKATDSWLLNIDKGKLNSVIFLDIKKAFDTVSHVEKLNRYGICEKELECLMSYLSDRGQCCSINPIQAGGHNVPPTGFFLAVLKRLAVV